MRTITLNKMRIENFKGIENLEISFDGKNTLISGFNGTGKSTIADAYFWVTTGKNAAGNARFEARPRNKEGNEVHDVITSVECEFIVVEENGEYGEVFTFSIRREELEDLTEKAKQELKPETIAKKKSFYFIDNAPYMQEIFYDKLGAIMCDKDKFSILSNPMAFFMLKEPEQRELLTMACGDVQDSEVEGYEQVKAICGAINTPTQVKDGLADSIRKTKKRLEEIPAQVEVLLQNCDEYADYDKQIAELEKQRAEVEEKGKVIKSGLDKLQATVSDLKEPSKREILEYEYEIKVISSTIKTKQALLQAAMELQEANTCPKCGYKLVDRQTDISDLNRHLKEYENSLSIYQESLRQAQEEYNKAMREYQFEVATQAKANETALQKRKDAETKIAELRQQFTELSVEISKLEQAKQVQSQIKALRDEQRKLDDQLADDITKHDIITAFLLKKAEKVVENINKRFTTVQFKLFEMQANGELKTCCKAMVNGVSYANINTAAKVQVGIELAKLFSEFYGVKAPLWVDDKESVLELPPVDTQLVCLKVDERYKELHIEVEND